MPQSTELDKNRTAYDGHLSFFITQLIAALKNLPDTIAQATFEANQRRFEKPTSKAWFTQKDSAQIKELVTQNTKDLGTAYSQLRNFALANRSLTTAYGINGFETELRRNVFMTTIDFPEGSKVSQCVADLATEFFRHFDAGRDENSQEAYTLPYNQKDAGHWIEAVRQGRIVPKLERDNEVESFSYEFIPGFELRFWCSNGENDKGIKCKKCTVMVEAKTIPEFQPLLDDDIARQLIAKMKTGFSSVIREIDPMGTASRIPAEKLTDVLPSLTKGQFDRLRKLLPEDKNIHYVCDSLGERLEIPFPLENENHRYTFTISRNDRGNFEPSLYVPEKTRLANQKESTDKIDELARQVADGVLNGETDVQVFPISLNHGEDEWLRDALYVFEKTSGLGISKRAVLERVNELISEWCPVEIGNWRTAFANYLNEGGIAPQDLHVSKEHVDPYGEKSLLFWSATRMPEKKGEPASKILVRKVYRRG